MTSQTWTPRPALRVAVELNGHGHHPALSVESGSGPESRWVDLVGGCDNSHSQHNVRVVRIQATDMARAHRERATLRSEIEAEGGDPDSIAVLVDVAVLIAPQARTARKQLMKLDTNSSGPRTIESLEYVGTPLGLAGLIADLYVVGVIDGVTILPLAERAVLDHIVNESLPWLTLRGLLPARAETVLARMPLR